MELRDPVGRQCNTELPGQQVSPYFLQNCWMKEGENTLMAAVMAPNILQTTVQNVPIKIEEITEYPYQNYFVFRMEKFASI